MTFSRYLATGAQPAPVPGGTHLPPMFSLIEPLERTNLVMNPSFEVDLTNWTTVSGSVTRSTSDSFKGGACLLSNNAAGGGALTVYGATTPLSLSSGSDYVLSFYARVVGTGLPNPRPSITFGVANTSNAFLASKTATLTGQWKRYTIPYRETSTTSRRLVWQLNGPNTSFVGFRMDAVQFELCESGNVYATTYIDGDQIGTLPRQAPYPFFWNGVPHNSTSTRAGDTTAGGRHVRLDQLGFQLLGVEGLSASHPDVQSVNYSELDGGELQRIRKGPREFTLHARFDADTFRRARSQYGAVAAGLDRDAAPIEQPLKFVFTPMDEYSNPIDGSEYEITCVYTGGLEGSINNFNTDVVSIHFEMFDPVIWSVQEYTSGSFTESTTLSTSMIASRSRAGVWGALGGGVTGGGGVLAIMRHFNGLVFIGGNFTGVPGGSADFCAIYNPATDTWSNIAGSDTTFNGSVLCFAMMPDGTLCAGGEFTNASGIANADGICLIGSTGSIVQAMGTGVTGGTVSVQSVCAHENFFYAGGLFTQMGGVANTNSIARYNATTATWSAVGTGVSGGNGVYALSSNGLEIFAGGSFTAMSATANTLRLARFEVSSSLWRAMSTGADDIVYSLLADKQSGDVYIGGIFQALGGISMAAIGKWNGYIFEKVGPAGGSLGFPIGAQVNDMAFDPSGRIWMVGTFQSFRYSSSDLLSVGPGVIIWDGTSMIEAPLEAGNGGCQAVNFAPDGTVYIGWTTDPDPEIPTRITCTNVGTARTYPRFRFTSSTNNAAQDFRFIGNYTTDRYAYLKKLQLSFAETILFDLHPRRLSLQSNYTGFIAGSTWPGTQLGLLYLIPGTNVFEILTDAATVGTGLMWWKAAYDSIDSVWPKALRSR